jgi:hypothetical protein
MTMSWSMAAALGGGLLLGAVVLILAVVSVRLARYRAGASEDAFPPDDFSVSRYQPMMRLLSEEDLEFLAAQPGYRAETGARLRRERRRIFRMYLRDLARDFRRLHCAARKVAADSPAGHSELVGLLVRYQITFWRSMAIIELRLLAPHAGVPRLDLAPLLKPMEVMQMYVSET